MRHEEGHLTLPATSRAAGARLYRQSWRPDEAAKAHVMLVHGYAEHSGRYDHVAAHLIDAGYAVDAIDHWGHGKSVGTPGFVPDFSVYLDGLDALYAHIRAEDSSTPVILLGHSLGGLICARYLLDHQVRFAACVLSGPAIKAAEEPSALLKGISGLLSSLTPRLGVVALDPNGVSRDPAVVEKYLADPLVYGGKIGARLASEMMHAMELVQARAETIHIPLLLMHGSEDSLTAPEGSEFLHAACGSTVKQLKIYPGLYHEIFNEPEQAEVLADMTVWLNELPRH